MLEFYYQIKGKAGESWLWPPLFTGKIEAENKKEARKKLEEELGRDLPQRVIKEKFYLNDFLLKLEEIKENDYHTKRLFEPVECKHCKKQFKVIEKYQHGNPGGGQTFCSNGCKEDFGNIEYMRKMDGTNYYGDQPVIYKITNKKTAKCYIGKTTQIFTLRWYQHFYHPTTSKFHEEIKNSSISDWLFEVVEVISISKDMNDRQQIEELVISKEREYIEKHNSILEGYNSKM
jgi:hypothetical protein